MKQVKFNTSQKKSTIMCTTRPTVQRGTGAKLK